MESSVFLFVWHRVHTVPPLTSLKVWGSAQEVGLTPGSVLKWLLVKFNGVIIPVTPGLPLYFLFGAPPPLLLPLHLLLFFFGFLLCCPFSCPFSSLLFHFFLSSVSLLFVCLFLRAFLNPSLILFVYFFFVFLLYFDTKKWKNLTVPCLELKCPHKEYKTQPWRRKARFFRSRGKCKHFLVKSAAVEKTGDSSGLIIFWVIQSRVKSCLPKKRTQMYKTGRSVTCLTWLKTSARLVWVCLVYVFYYLAYTLRDGIGPSGCRETRAAEHTWLMNKCLNILGPVHSSCGPSGVHIFFILSVLSVGAIFAAIKQTHLELFKSPE